MTNILNTYIPMDRRQAWARHTDLTLLASGSALFADISGFTRLSETLVLELGARRGAEVLTFHLNSVYDELIGVLYDYRGSVIGFSGDAITCWLDADNGMRAVTCALAMHDAIQAYPEISTPSGIKFSLAMKASVAIGRVRRFVVGNQDYRLFDVMTGDTLEQLAAADYLAERGDVIVSETTVRSLDEFVDVSEWRVNEDRQERFAVVRGVRTPVTATPWPSIPDNILSQYENRPWIPAAVYERLSQGQEQFIAELRPVDTLFLRFSGIDYENDEESPQQLQIFISLIEKVIARYEGSLLHVAIGDKGSYLYAAFGAPIAHEDDTVRAISAALEMQVGSKDLAFITSVQIGISRGRIYSGSYGSKLRRTYGVIGDAVNLAARLMQAASHGQVLVSEEVRHISGDTFQWDAQPPLFVKGKRDALRTYRLLGKTEESAAHLIEPRYSLDMVGRKAELALFQQKLTEVVDGKGQILGIVAEAGMGKSRLAAQVIETAIPMGIKVYAGECQSYGKDTSYLVWQSVWRNIFGLRTGQTPAEQVEHVMSSLKVIRDELVPRLPLLSSIINLSIPDNELTESFDAKLRKTSLEALLTDCLRYYTQESPLLLVLDDCQWLDNLSRDLIEIIGRALANLPVMMILVYRPLDPLIEQEIPASTLAHFTEVPLNELTQEEAEQLINLKLEQFFGTYETPPADFVKRITTRAAGNPFYIEEILNYLRDRGLSPGDEHSLEELELPTSLQSLILSRIDQLSEREKITLKVASVIGRLFQAAMVWGVYPEVGTWEQLKNDLQTLDDLALTPLEAPEPELTYIFKHILTQEVAYESLLYSTRATLHEQIGRYIEQTYPDDLDQYVNLLAFHYEHSENEDKKRGYLLRAGKAAQASYANAAAIDYYEKVIPLLTPHEQLPILRELGKVNELVGKWDEAREIYEKTLVNSMDLGENQEKAWSELAIGELFRKRGWYQEAMGWLNSSQSTFEALSYRSGVGAVVHTKGTVAAQQGQFQEALALYDASVAIRQELGEEQFLANLHSNIGIVYRYMGDLNEARNHYQQSLSLARKLNNRQNIAITLNNMGNLALQQGRVEEARMLLEEAVTIQRAIGNRFYEGNALNNLGNVERTLGNYSRAASLYADSLNIYRDLEDLWALAYLFEDVGTLAALQSDGYRALCLVAAASKLREQIGAPLKANEKEQLERELKSVYELLSVEEQEAAATAGLSLSLEDAIAYAIGEA